MHFSTIAYLALLAQGTTTALAASLTLEDICSYTMSSGKEAGATICLRGDQPLEFAKEVSGTAKLGATGVQLCCMFFLFFSGSVYTLVVYIPMGLSPLAVWQDVLVFVR